MFWTLVGLTCLLAAVTLLPLSRSERWWVRGLDFPRLQFATFALVLLATTLWRAAPERPLWWAMLAVDAGCLAWQGWWILPYLPGYPRQVPDAGPDPVDTLAILACNVLTPNRRADELIALVRRYRPDVLIAVETDRWWQSRLDALVEDYPHVLRCPLDNLYGMLVYSRLPLEDGQIRFLVEEDVPSAHAAVVLPSGRRVSLHCLHPRPPSPTENPSSGPRDAELVVVGRRAAEETLPVIVTGDLNDVAWSATTRLFSRVSGLLDPRVGRGMFNSFHARYPFLRWPLDHLFHSAGFTLVDIRRLPPMGSDHFPMLIQLALEPERQKKPAPTADAEDHELACEKASREHVSPSDVPGVGP